MRGYKPLLMMRTRGLMGPFFHKAANLRSNLVRSVGNWISSGGGFLPPHFDDFNFLAAFKGETDVQNVGINGWICNQMPKGVVTATSVHSTPIMAPDYQGIYQEYPIDAPVWKWGRVETKEEIVNGDFATGDLTGWTLGANWEVIDFQAHLNATAVRDFIFQSVFGGLAGQTVIVSFDLEVLVGAVRFEWGNASPSAVTVLGVSDSGHHDIELQLIDSGVNRPLIGSDTDDAVAILDNFSVKVKGGDVETTYATNEAGAALPQHPYLQANKATTNLLYPSTPSEDSGINSFTIPATEHILWMEGTGSITSSYGTATEAVPLVFTGTAAPVLFTAVGAPQIAQIESGNLKTTYVPTTTAAVSIVATDYIYPAANLDPADAVLEYKIDYQGDDTVVFDIGGRALVEVGDFAGDGNNIISNGDFTNGFADWTLVGDSHTIVAGACRINRVTSSTYIQQIALQANTDFLVEFDLVNGAGSNGDIIVRLGGLNYTYLEGEIPLGSRFSQNLTCGGFTEFRIYSNTNGGIVYVDNISVEQLAQGIKLEDASANQITAPLSTDQHSVKVVLGTLSMSLTVDEILIDASAYVPITAGLITCEEDLWAVRTSPVVVQPILPPAPPVTCVDVIYASHLDGDILNDSTTTNVVPILNGDAELSIVDPKFGSGAAYVPKTIGSNLEIVGTDVGLVRSIQFYFKITDNIPGLEVHGLLYAFGGNLSAKVLYNNGKNGDLSLTVFGTNTEVDVDVTTGVWHQLEITIGGGADTLFYYDGVLVLTTVTYDPTAAGSKSILFGASSSANLGGYIDDILVTSTILNSENYPVPTEPYETTCGIVVIDGGEIVTHNTEEVTHT